MCPIFKAKVWPGYAYKLVKFGGFSGLRVKICRAQPLWSHQAFSLIE